jgi:hypothetical protein
VSVSIVTPRDRQRRPCLSPPGRARPCRSAPSRERLIELSVGPRAHLEVRAHTRIPARHVLEASVQLADGGRPGRVGHDEGVSMLALATHPVWADYERWLHAR